MMTVTGRRDTRAMTSPPVDVPLAHIVVSSLNTRKNMDAGTEDADLEALAQSICEQGLLQPPLLRATGPDRYEVVAGQRRVLACQRLGWSTILAVVRELSDEEAVAVSLVENVQRADMHPIDKARAFRALENQRGTVRARRPNDRSHRQDRPPLLGAARPSGRTASPGPDRRWAHWRRVHVHPRGDITDPEEAVEVFEKVQGFKGWLASEIVKRSGGRLDDIDELVDQGIAGQFDRAKCGSSVETCPYIPERLRAVVRSMIESDD